MPGATGLVLNPNSPRLYVNAWSGGISIIDTGSNTVIKDDLSAGGFVGLAIKPDGARLYALGFLGGISVIDITNDDLNVVATPLAPFGVGLAAHPDGTRIYVTNSGGNSVSVLNTATNTVAGAPIPVGMFPTAFGQFIPPASVQGLIALVQSFNLKPNIANSWISKLKNALASLGSAKPGNRQDAVNKLNAFLSEVEAQRGKALTNAQADQLKNMANNIIAVLAVNLTVKQGAPPVTIQTAALVVPGIQSLIDAVTVFNLKQGIDSSSDPKMQAAQAALAAAAGGQPPAALQPLQLFIDRTQAQKGHGLTGAQAGILVKAARRLIALL